MNQVSKDIQEMMAYTALCQKKYPGQYEEACFLEYADGARAARMAAELAYIMENNAVASWAKIIEAFHIREDGRRVMRMFEDVQPNFKDGGK
jgi:hypothetical protein